MIKMAMALMTMIRMRMVVMMMMMIKKYGDDDDDDDDDYHCSFDMSITGIESPLGDISGSGTNWKIGR